MSISPLTGEDIGHKPILPYTLYSTSLPSLSALAAVFVFPVLWPPVPDMRCFISLILAVQISSDPLALGGFVEPGLYGGSLRHATYHPWFGLRCGFERASRFGLCVRADGRAAGKNIQYTLYSMLGILDRMAKW